MKIGLMGGTFDPIHNGHLVLAEQVRTRFELDKIVFIPSGNPPHKKAISAKEDRYEMTVLAINDNEHFEISTIELECEDYTYTIDTVKKLKEENKDAEFYFITGADAVIDLPKWKDFKELIRICKFIGSTRPGFEYDALKDSIDMLVKDYGADITITEVPALSISSTDIRRRVKYGMSIRYLLPRSAELYIYKKSLYEDRREIL